MKYLLATAAIMTAATMAGANSDEGDTPLDRLSRHSEVESWAAVGRVDHIGGGFCTGSLIEPDLVLTAAHCLIERGSSTPIDPAKIVFRAGFRDGTSVATERALQTVVHPDYTDKTSGRAGSLTTDIGLIRLASPIPMNLATPFQVSNQAIGDSVSVLSYGMGRSEALSLQRTCSVHAKWEDQGAAAFTCDATFGSSGSPVFDTSATTPRIVSVMSRIRQENGRIISYGPLVRDSINDLRAALQASRGVNMAGGGVASVVQRTEGARFIRADQGGARFIRP